MVFGRRWLLETGPPSSFIKKPNHRLPGHTGHRHARARSHTMSLIKQLYGLAASMRSTAFRAGMLLLPLTIAHASTSLKSSMTATHNHAAISTWPDAEVLIVHPDTEDARADDEEHEDAHEPLDIKGLSGLDPVVTMLPVDLAHVTSQFGHRRDPFKHRIAFHAGIDFGAPKGTPVYAVADGIVLTATNQRSYGKVVVIKHANGYRTLYAHNSQLLVKPGQTIHAGDRIAKVGSTGRSTGSHLHFEVHRSGERVDPSPYLAGL